jgi:hypothetical protein
MGPRCSRALKNYNATQARTITIIDTINVCKCNPSVFGIIRICPGGADIHADPEFAQGSGRASGFVESKRNGSSCSQKLTIRGQEQALHRNGRPEATDVGSALKATRS